MVKTLKSSLPDPLPDGILVGYVRVSTREQNEQRQIDELLRYGVDERDIWIDKASGKDMKRPAWQGLWKDVQPGDTVVVLALDRLGRNLVELVTTVDGLKSKGVGLKVLNGDIDTNTLVGRMMLGIFGALAEYERGLIIERAQHGLDRARERGVIGGRPAKMTVEMVDKAIARVQAGETAKDIAAEYQVHRNSLKRRMDRRRNMIRKENKL